LHELHQRLIDVLGSLAVEFEIIFVEDCGPDNSWEVIEELAKTDPHVRGIKLSRNFGQHAATICGICHAKGEQIITMDDDLEQSPEDIPKLLTKAEEGYALIYGTYSQRSHAWWRNVTSDIGRWVFNKAIPSLNYEYTAFRLIDGRVAKALTEFDSPFPFVDGYLAWVTNHCASVPVMHSPRASGTSNYSLRKLLAHTLNIFVTFSDVPLRIASYLGLLFFFIGMFWFAAVIFGKITGYITVSGFASVVAAIVLFGGIQLLILGVFGEYLGRVNFKSSRKPLFLVGNTTEQPRQ